MKLKFISVLIMLLIIRYGASTDGAETTKVPILLGDTWTTFIDVIPPTSLVEVPPSLLSPKNMPVLPQILALQNHTIDLASHHAGKVNEHQIAILYNEFSANQPKIMRVGFSADWFMEVYLNGNRLFSSMDFGNHSHEFKPDDNPVDLPVRAGKNILAVKVRSGSAGWRFVCGETSPTTVFQADHLWKPVDMSNVRITEGTAIDLSSSLTNNNCARLIVGTNGRLAVVGAPEHPLRLMGFQGWPYGYPFAGKTQDHWKQAIREFTVDMRRQGYNFTRLCFEDICTDGDKIIDPVRLDIADYYLSQLKANNSYCQLVLGGYGLYQKDPWGEPFRRRDITKAKIYAADPATRDLWKFGAQTLLNHINPYTGLAWKDDPVIGFVEYFNELEMGILRFDSKADDVTRQLYVTRFRDWLKNKYAEPAILAKAWNAPSLADSDGFMKADLPAQGDPGSVKKNDYYLFLNALGIEFGRWCEGIVRGTGYAGLVTQHNFVNLMFSQQRYEISQVVNSNTYFNHPSNFSKSGSKVNQNSAVGSAASYWRSAASTRLPDRPFVVTEHNHAFWNRYQHEEGLLFPAYCGLQGFDGMVVHCNPVLKSVISPMEDFTVGRSPIARANEFVAACLFRRGDITASPHLIKVKIPESFFNVNQNSIKALSSLQTQLSLVCGFAIDFPWAKQVAGVSQPRASNHDFLIDGASAVGAEDWAISIKDNKDNIFSLVKAFSELRRKNILSEDNASKPEFDVFQSDTGQITLRSRENLLKVITPFAEGVTIENNVEEAMKELTVKQTSTPAMIAACAMDGEQLRSSRRIVLVYSTEAVNTGMEVTPDRVTLIQLGKFPPLMRVGKLSATLVNKNPRNLSLYALSISGERVERLPITINNNTIELEIDTAVLKKGPTTFFELADK